MSTAIHSKTGDSCTDSWSRSHGLVCGHTIAGERFEAVIEEKQPCGPNCVRYSILQATGINMAAFEKICEQPFVCPVCIGEYVAWYRVGIGAHYQRYGWGIPSSEEDQINLFTYHMVRRCVDQYGMRMADAGNGVGRVRLGELPPPRFGESSAAAAQMGDSGDYRGANDQHDTDMEDGDATAVGQSFAGNVDSGGEANIDGLADRLLEVRIGEATDDIIGALMTGLTALSVA
jgi:hypothetical protein